MKTPHSRSRAFGLRASNVKAEPPRLHGRLQRLVRRACQGPCGFLGFPHTDMEEVGHNLGVLQVGAGEDGGVAWTWLLHALEQKAGVDQQIQPLAHGPREPRNLELRQSLRHVRRCRPEEPLGNLPVAGAKVVADLYRIRAAVLVAEIPAVRGIEAGMSKGELQETT